MEDEKKSLTEEVSTHPVFFLGVVILILGAAAFGTVSIVEMANALGKSFMNYLIASQH